MPRNIFFILWILIFTHITEEKKFPKGFKLGVATASYQIEGGWNADGQYFNFFILADVLFYCLKASSGLKFCTVIALKAFLNIIKQNSAKINL